MATIFVLKCVAKKCVKIAVRSHLLLEIIFRFERIETQI